MRVFLDLFIELGANDEQLEFPIVYGMAKRGIATLDPEDLGEDVYKIDKMFTQLLNIEKFKPEVSTIINLTPDHLDYMASLDEYYASKMNIYMNCADQDVYVINKDDPVLKEYLEDRITETNFEIEKADISKVKKVLIQKILQRAI